MLQGKKLVVIGGDNRYVQVISHLAANGAEVSAVGFEEIDFNQVVRKHRKNKRENFHATEREIGAGNSKDTTIFHRTLDEIDFSKMDGIILPIGGTDETGKIHVEYGRSKPILTADILKQTKPECVIYSGTAKKYLLDLAAHCDRKLINLFARDDVAIANSIPTAEATLQIAMENTNFTIHGANVLVVGFGRVGITTARLFQNVGANVTVAARKQADFARIREMNMKTIHIKALKKAATMSDICINTVPVLLLDEPVLQEMPADRLIIDVASMPGGTDFEAADKYGITAIHALGLPGKFAPITAGKILGEVLTELICGRDE